MERYYEVVAKCGHVGKGWFYRGFFYEKAEDGREAAMIVRGRGRVKHNHKDAILSVKEIAEEEYWEGVERKKHEKYFLCENLQEQRMYWDEISAHIFPESRDDEEETAYNPHVRRHQKEKPFNWRNYDWDDAA